MRAVSMLLSWFVLLLPLAAPASAAGVDEKALYSAVTFVTGQREETRRPGIEETFRQVLVKVTGTSHILQDERLGAEIGRAGDYVASYSYRDRMEGIPHHDEQGSRDRPYDLTVHFEPEKIDTLITDLGFEKWPLPRPVITPLVKVEFQGNGFFLTNDGAEGNGQRDALLAEADKRGLTIALPDVATLAAVDVGSMDADNPPASTLADLARRSGGDVILNGILTWDAEKLLWKARWSIAYDGSAKLWDEASTTFDAAFRDGLGGASELLRQAR
ncbi:DUF2066 domain-containing protein [Breoghania sp. JC706]|uniref:DUF2066 domain-containing protein n=1 Tax=Breoghania sp. JC706 TaxID=3117732 RepID=UPI003008D793